MAEFDVVAYLQSKGLQGRQANGPEVTYPCFFECDEPPHSRKRKLYVNTEEGFYDCKVCGAAGGTYLLQKHFGDEPEKLAPGKDPHTRRRILDWSAEVGSAMLANNDDVLNYLMNDRGLSAETIVEAQLGFVGNNWSLVDSLPESFSKDQLRETGLVYRDGPRADQDFFYSHLLIPYTQRGHVVQMRGRAWNTTGKGGKYLTGPGEPVRMYGLDDLDGAEDVIITEGEFDRLVVKQHLATAPDDRARRIAVIALAGANGFKEGFESFLSNAKRVYIALDPDDTGRREAIKIKDRLGTRARIVELPPELPKCDWSEYLLPIPAGASEHWRAEHPHAGHTWSDVMSLIGNASGKRVHRIREAGFSYRLQIADRINAAKTGWAELDAIIFPGVKPGQVVIPLAKTGTGKTIWLCNLAYNMRDKHILFLSLEMTREEIYERLCSIYRFHHPFASDGEVEAGLNNILICDENRLSETDVESLVAEYEVEHGEKCAHVFMDYLGYFCRGCSGNGQYEKTTNGVMALKAIAKKCRIVMWAPSQVNRGADDGKPLTLDDARDSGAIEETADFLLGLYRPDNALTVEGARPSGVFNIEILKSRHGGKGRRVQLLFDNLTLAIVEKDGKLAHRVEKNNRLHERGVTYAELRAQELMPVQSELTYRRSA